jgi:hypothetical protein
MSVRAWEGVVVAVKVGIEGVELLILVYGERGEEFL